MLTLILAAALLLAANSPQVLMDSDAKSVLALEMQQWKARAEFQEADKARARAEQDLADANARMTAKLAELRRTYDCADCLLKEFYDKNNILTEIRWQKK